MKYEILNPPDFDEDEFPYVDADEKDLDSAKRLYPKLQKEEDGSYGDGEFLYFCREFPVLIVPNRLLHHGDKIVKKPIWFRATTVCYPGSRWEPDDYDLSTLNDGFTYLWEAVAQSLVERYEQELRVKADNHCYACDGVTEDIYGKIPTCKKCNGKGWVHILSDPVM